jgi:N-acetylmuramoyl-L-alanine amidase CwlA
LKICKAQRGDTGKYEVVLKNVKGEIAIPIQVEVTDKPSAPKGPLKVTDVTSQTANISWHAPEDDGGSHLINYIVEKMDVSKGEWSPVEVVPPNQTSLSLFFYKTLIENSYFRTEWISNGLSRTVTEALQLKNI